jgi:D-alanyl-D-alanine carboxypeptidase/Putative peptidoglycan binding domain
MAIKDLIEIPESINQGVSAAKQRTMLALLGNPRGSYNQTCQPVQHPVLVSLITTEDVGPFRATGLAPAIESLKAVMADIKQQEADVYEALGTAGMHCARFVRNSTTTISNHSWGTAIDLTLDGQLDVRGDNRVHIGLARIAPIFNRHGWFWGAGFGTEDGMHFEVGEETIRAWHASGKFVKNPGPAPEPLLSIGNRGPEVRKLQEKLNERGAGLVVDGVFGRNTQAAVMAFQAVNGLEVDGLVGKET